jgi:hypothetical protein
MWSNGLTAYPTGEEVGAPIVTSYHALYKLIQEPDGDPNAAQSVRLHIPAAERRLRRPRPRRWPRRSQAALRLLVPSAGPEVILHP